MFKGKCFSFYIQGELNNHINHLKKKKTKVLDIFTACEKINFQVWKAEKDTSKIIAQITLSYNGFCQLSMSITIDIWLRHSISKRKQESISKIL